MKNNKYYTPTIEEFHVGFEFESNYALFGDTNQWNKVTLNIKEYNWFWHSYLHNAVETEFRVKYLDKEDIESFGFKEDKSNSTPDRLNLELCKNGFTLGIVLYDKIELIIYKYKVKEEILFRGIIKNKSELKKILTQIKVI